MNADMGKPVTFLWDDYNGAVEQFDLLWNKANGWPLTNSFSISAPATTATFYFARRTIYRAELVARNSNSVSGPSNQVQFKVK